MFLSNLLRRLNLKRPQAALAAPQTANASRLSETKSQKATSQTHETAQHEPALERPLGADYLGKAAMARHAAKDAVSKGNHDEAWGLYHEEKDWLMRHAMRSRFSERDLLALDATVHEELANILRKEGKHLDAFVHILYWVSVQRHRPLKRQPEKLRAYFNRSGIASVALSDVEEFVQGLTRPSFADADKAVRRWTGKG